MIFKNINFNGDIMNYKSLIFYVLMTLIIGISPSIFVYSNDIYETINKPLLSPPGIVFPIVWFILFILMGTSMYLVSKKTKEEEYYKIYFLQLFFNVLWTPLFFGLGSFFLALIDLLLLIVLVVLMIKKFKSIEKTSAYLNVPYLIWLLFAFYLNISIVLLNS